jgi:hypothetical protein
MGRVSGVHKFESFYMIILCRRLIRVATRSEAWVCDRSLVRIASSNPVVTFAANRNISLELRERGGGRILRKKNSMFS